MRLKVEGILECGELLVAALAGGREAHIFGRRTMPEMDLASVACAIQNLWLAARAENVGMGWVSLFDPEALRLLMHMPKGSRPVAVLCLGYVAAFYQRPMLEEANWAHRLLGHSSVAMSLRYAHLAPDQRREAVAKLNVKPLLALTLRLQAGSPSSCAALSC